MTGARASINRSAGRRIGRNALRRFDTRAVRLISEARADQSSANSCGPEFSTISTFSTPHSLLDAFFEKAAVLEFDEGLVRREAEARAAEALGAVSPERLFARVVADWRASIDAFAEAGPNRRGLTWCADARRLIDSGIVLEALECGWDALALWSVRPMSWPEEYSAVGLGPRLKGRELMAIDQQTADLGGGVVMIKPVVDARRGDAVFWEAGFEGEESRNDQHQ